MSILAIDYGAKKIGIARSDEAGMLALPLEVLPNTGRDAVKRRIAELCEQNNVERIIVGVPMSLSSRNGEIALREVDLQNKQMQEVLDFVKWLKKQMSVPVGIEDERLSTKLANRLRKDLVKKGPDDAVAAMLILQAYLDRLNPKS